MDNHKTASDKAEKLKQAWQWPSLAVMTFLFIALIITFVQKKKLAQERNEYKQQLAASEKLAQSLRDSLNAISNETRGDRYYEFIHRLETYKDKRIAITPREWPFIERICRMARIDLSIFHDPPLPDETKDMLDSISVERGKQFLVKHKAFLDSQYNLQEFPQELVVAVLRKETDLNEYLGSWRVIDTYLTIFTHADKAAEWENNRKKVNYWRYEYALKHMAYLIKSARESGWNAEYVAHIMGSNRGCFTSVQLTAENYYLYAIYDGNENGITNAIEDIEDAILAMIALYKKNGWTRNKKGKALFKIVHRYNPSSSQKYPADIMKFAELLSESKKRKRMFQY